MAIDQQYKTKQAFISAWEQLSTPASRHGAAAQLLLDRVEVLAATLRKRSPASAIWTWPRHAMTWVGLGIVGAFLLANPGVQQNAASVAQSPEPEAETGSPGEHFSRTADLPTLQRDSLPPDFLRPAGSEERASKTTLTPQGQMQSQGTPSSRETEALASAAPARGADPGSAIETIQRAPTGSQEMGTGQVSETSLDSVTGDSAGSGMAEPSAVDPAYQNPQLDLRFEELARRGGGGIASGRTDAGDTRMQDALPAPTTADRGSARRPADMIYEMTLPIAQRIYARDYFALRQDRQ